MMESKAFAVLLLLSSVVLSTSKTWTSCNDNPGTLKESRQVSVTSRPLTKPIRFVRFPTTGEYSTAISCFKVFDLFEDDASGEVEIYQGGIDHTSVGLKLTGHPGGELQYEIKINCV